MITVYGTPPTRSMRVIWMLEEMGLPYEVKPVAFETRLQNREFLEASPTGSYPGLRDGDIRLMESCAILEYLGAKYGPTPIVPKPTNPEYPAHISYLHFGEASLSAPLNVTIATRFFAPDDQKQNWGAQHAIEMFIRKSAALAAPLRKSPYVAGNTFTAADISCGFAVDLARFLGFDDRLDATLKDYAARLAQRPAYQKMLATRPAPH